jgi:hypothetical protein
MDGITAGGFDRLAVSPHLAPANIGVFVNNNGQAATLINQLSVALTAGGFTIVDTSGQLGVSTRPGAANIGIFVNDNGQAGTLIDRLSLALTASGFTFVDTPARFGVSTNLGAANIGIFVNDSGQAGMLADTPRFAPAVRKSVQIGSSGPSDDLIPRPPTTQNRARTSACRLGRERDGLIRDREAPRLIEAKKIAPQGQWMPSLKARSIHQRGEPCYGPVGSSGAYLPPRQTYQTKVS